MKVVVRFWAISLLALFGFGLLGSLAGAALVGQYFSVVGFLGPGVLLLWIGATPVVCGVVNLVTAAFLWGRTSSRQSHS